MKIIDITNTLTSEIPVWPGDPHVNRERFAKIEEGSPCNNSKITLSVHTGTHMDAPYHFVPDGITIEQLSLETLVGKCQVVQIPDHCDLVTAEDLKKVSIDPATIRLLLKTRNSQYWQRNEKEFQRGFVALSPDGAQYLVEKGIKLVGIDYLSIAPFADGVPTHVTLLRAGVIVFEGANLSEVESGFYQLCCLPLKLGGSDGAPVRAILIKE